MVHKIKDSSFNMNTNFRKALDLILETAVENQIPSEDMENMTLIIFSDMQIDNPWNTCENNNTMFETMKEKYLAFNYSLPHIIFWNLRKIDGFPNLCSQQNTSMMSGSNPNLLNSFAEKGIETLKTFTPIKNLLNELNKNRYKYLEKKIEEIWNSN